VQFGLDGLRTPRGKKPRFLLFLLSHLSIECIEKNHVTVCFVGCLFNTLSTSSQ
jgi:hypothetical protein